MEILLNEIHKTIFERTENQIQIINNYNTEKKKEKHFILLTLIYLSLKPKLLRR